MDLTLVIVRLSGRHSSSSTSVSPSLAVLQKYKSLVCCWELLQQDKTTTICTKSWRRNSLLLLCSLPLRRQNGFSNSFRLQSSWNFTAFYSHLTLLLFCWGRGLLNGFIILWRIWNHKVQVQARNYNSLVQATVLIIFFPKYIMLHSLLNSSTIILSINQYHSLLLSINHHVCLGVVDMAGLELEGILTAAHVWRGYDDGGDSSGVGA